MHIFKVIVALICFFFCFFVGGRQVLCAMAKAGSFGGLEWIAVSAAATYLAWFFFM